MTADLVLLTIARIEAQHLAGLVQQFSDLLRETEDASSDPAVARLVPDAYPDDAAAAGEFRHATEDDLLDRRRDDADRVLATLSAAGGLDGPADTEVVDVALSPDDARAWMRALAAIRLVIASRLGIASEEDHDEDDPRFGVYDWLGYRLEGLIHAIDAE